MAIDTLYLSLRTERERLGDLYADLDDGVFGDRNDVAGVRMAVSDAMDALDRAMRLRELQNRNAVT